MQYRDWANADEFLAYVGEQFPFHAEWPDPGPVSVHSAMGDGDTPLHVASAWGDLKAAQLLLEAGAAVDRPGDMGITPLGTAVSNGHARVAELLLSNGASPHRKSEFNVSPLEQALQAGSAELTRAFAKYAGA